MIYSYIGDPSTQIMHYYNFSYNDRGEYVEFSTYYFAYEFSILYVNNGSSYTLTLSFENVSGFEDTAGMDCLFYLQSDITSNYYNTNLPNTNIPDFNLSCNGNSDNFTLVITLGYTSATYQDNYRNEYESGYDAGYQNGYYDGGEGVNINSYQNGYDAGYQTGYTEGYNESNSEFTGVFALLGQAFSSTSTLYRTTVIGGLSIGTFIIIPLTVTIVLSIFKMLRK